MSATGKSLDLLAIEMFESYLQQPEEHQQQWLIEQTETQPELREKVLRLIKLDSSSSGVIHTGNVKISDEEEPIPERIGVYRITGLIGRGGMGAVFRAQRDQGDFEHDVAIKLIRPGVMSDALVKRFEHERQTLANLQHPNIAALYDGGTSESGAPYFVMEYVDGLAITQFANQHELNLNSRLDLFRKVCQAVHYAHQNLIAHRDITPSNVLVNQSGEVKLIDFGIAKPFDLEGSQEVLPHSLTSLSFTPGYAAPERELGMEGNTLADIYSLGKLLQAMIDGCSPSKELVAIGQTATHLDPNNRYQSVSGLMRDVERFQQNFPVSVYSNGRIYAVGKFVRRHKATVAIAASGITAVLVALALTFLQYQRAERHLEESIERFDQVRELAKYQIFDLYDALKSVVGNTAIRAELAQKGQEYLSSLYQHSADSPQLQLETAQGFIRLARIYGVPAEPNLGDVTLARANLSKAEQLLSAMSNRNPNWPGLKTTQVALMAAQAMILVHDNSDLLAALSLTDQADKLLLQVAEAQRDNYWYQTQRELRYAQFERADQGGQSQVIRDLANQSVAVIKNWPLAMQQSHIAEFDRAWYYYWMGLADYNDNLHEQAMENFEQGHTLLTELAERRGNDPMLLYIIAWNNYIAYGSAARLYQTERSMTFLDRATAASARLAELQEGDASIIRLGMQMREAKSQLLAELGRIDEAIGMQEALVVDQETNAKGKPEASQFETWAFSKIILAYMYRDANRREDACVELEQAEQLLKPFAEKGLLADYMMNAAQRLDSRIQQCRSGQPIASQNALFD